MTGKVTLAVALTAALTLAACGDDGEPPLSHRTVTFTEQETENFGFADNPPSTKVGDEGPQQLSGGDQLTFSNDLLDGAHEDVGDLEASCTVTRPGGFDDSHLQCAGTATLPGGTLTLARGALVKLAGDLAVGCSAGMTPPARSSAGPAPTQERPVTSRSPRTRPVRRGTRSAFKCQSGSTRCRSSRSALPMPCASCCY